MLKRKIEQTIINYLTHDSNKIMIIMGARQVGKSYIIRHVATETLKERFKNYIEVNFVEDYLGSRLFEKINNKDDFYFQLSMIAGDRIGAKNDTLVFLDEIQQYPQFLTMLKFLKQDDRFTYICSGSLLGITLFKSTSIPIGSIDVIEMFPLDFEEFLWANGLNESAVSHIRRKFELRESLDEATHHRILNFFKQYLLVGGLPDAVTSFLNDRNIVEIRKIQSDIQTYYGDDAAKYDKGRKLKINRIYEMIPSMMENRKKRLIIQDVEQKKGKRFTDYQDAFDYLIQSGIALEVKAVSSPVFPLIQSGSKNLLKLYLNDVGILTGILYQNNIHAVLNDEESINLGSVYESVVASELRAHGHRLYYYDNKTKGEVDFLIDDYQNLTVAPFEIKSGKDYWVHSAIDKFLANPDCHIKKGYVLSNERTIFEKDNILYLPIYMIMFF